MYPTSPKLRCVLGACLALTAVSPLKATTVTVDSSDTKQEIDGFGASIITYSGLMRNIYNEPEFLDFVVNDLGLSILRVQVWPRVLETPVENWEDISHEDFIWTDGGLRGQVSTDFSVAIKQLNPEIQIIGSIWSPPAWMKENGSITGTQSGFLLDGARDYDHDNRLRDDRLQHFVKFLVEYQKALISEGVELSALGVQNEPMFTQSFESNLVTGPEYARLVKTLAEQFAAEGMEKPLFYGPEDMTAAAYNPDPRNEYEARHSSYVDSLMAEDVAPYFDIWATHGYSDGVNIGNALDPERYWNSIKQFGRPYWITEGSTGGHEWPEPIKNGVAAHIHHALTGGNASAVVAWQISDTVANEHALMHLRNPTPKTYAAMHYWRFIRPGAVRVATVQDDENIRISAFIHPGNHQLIIVAINSTDNDLPLSLELQGDFKTPVFERHRTSATLNCEDIGPITVTAANSADTLPANSITTYVGSAEGWIQDAALGPVQDVGEGWVWHTPMGHIYPTEVGWYYSVRHGWQYPVQGSFPRGLVIYAADHGWLYANKHSGPWLYSYETGEWFPVEAELP